MEDKIWILEWGTFNTTTSVYDYSFHSAYKSEDAAYRGLTRAIKTFDNGHGGYRHRIYSTTLFS